MLIGVLILLPIILPIIAFKLARDLTLRARKILFTLTDGSIVGMPFAAEEAWRYQKGNTCAIEAQRVILSLLGISKENSDLSARQKAYGGYDEKQGASSIKLLLDGYGIKTEPIDKPHKDFNFKIWHKLSQGRLILATTNSHLLNNTEDFFAPKIPIHDHVIIITALIKTPQGTLATYTDPGVFDGSLKAINIKHLKESTHSGTFLATPIIPNRTTSTIESILSRKKKICCPRCRLYMRVPFGKIGTAKCEQCNSIIKVDDSIIGKSFSHIKFGNIRQAKREETQTIESALLAACNGDIAKMKRLIAYEKKVSKNPLSDLEAAQNAYDRLIKDRR